MTRSAGAKPVALITGASAGIGAAYASALAGRGYDLVLVARSVERLELLARGLRERHGSAIECARADLSDERGVAAVVERIRDGADIDLLINNAGRGSFGRFWERDGDEETGLVYLNAIAAQRLSHAALARFVPRGSGSLILVSSLSGLQSGPFSATYSASKAFVNSFAEALREELRGSGVRIQLLCPGFTRTEFQERASVPAHAVPRAAWTSAEVVVASSLRALARDRFRCTPGLFSKGLGWALRAAPRGVATRVSGWVTKPLTR